MTTTEPHRPRQPWLHELLVSVRGNVTSLGDDGGDLERGTVHGVYADAIERRWAAAAA